MTENELITRVIPHLVWCSWWNPHPLSSSRQWTAIHFHDSLARENVEKLLRVMVEVANLRVSAGMRS